MVEESSGNVFADIGLPDAGIELAKAQIAIHIAEHIKALKLKQSEVGRKLGLSQPDVSRLVNGRPTGFSTDRLIALLNALDLDVNISIQPRKLIAEVRVTELVAAK